MRIIAFFAFTLLLFSGHAAAQSVYIDHDASPQAVYASRRLTSALEERGLDVADAARGSDYQIRLRIAGRLREEAFTISRSGRRIAVNGGDARGMIYGALAVAEDVRRGIGLANIQARSEAPQNQLRAIKHNLPWDSYRPSAALDQHLQTTRDLVYWEAFLDMMAENRFNALTLWNQHPWTYMVRPRNFPEASPFNDAELAEWRRLHEGIFRLARERGIDTYLVPWNIFVSREFAQAHNVGLVNTYPYYNTQGDNSEIIRRYVRETVAQVLEEYPDLTGIGLSPGEGMGGMTPEERQDWLNDTYLVAIRSVDRPVRIIWKAPQSSGLDMGGSTSRETERLTRRAMEAVDFAEGPIWFAQKFNWSHGHSTPTLVGVHGGQLGDTYFAPQPNNYRVTWIVRNEDFFALRWGVPSFVREHIQVNGSQDYMGGYIIGSETYIPALDYFTAVEGRDWRFAFERQWLFYKLWGRLLYNPETPDEVFSDEFVRRYGPQGRSLLRAYELASATPLRLASLYNSTWDHTLYSEGQMTLAGRTMAYISVDLLIQQAVLDPAYVSIADYVAANIAGSAFDADRITPPRLADRLEADSREALRLVEAADTTGNVALMYEVADIRAWAHLGIHLAEQIRGGVALQTYRLAGGADNRPRAIAHLETALEEWDEVVAITRPIYRDMLLTHFIGHSTALNPDAVFHWERIRPQVAADVEVARRAVGGPQ